MRERAMIEICCGSYEDALAADRGGAERIELNSALALGGLTPSAGCVKLVKKNTGLKVISMVRPRGAGFNYTEAETEQMFADGEELLKAGSDGLAFGFLTEDREIDRAKACRKAEAITAAVVTAYRFAVFLFISSLQPAFLPVLR